MTNRSSLGRLLRTWRALVAVAGLSLLSACATSAPAPMPGGGRSPTLDQLTEAEREQIRVQAREAVMRFASVVQTIEPVAERECRRAQLRRNCDFLIVVDDRLDQPPNAFQFLDEDGRPVLAFTLSLLADVQNADEMAFVMSHEAAHHILDHLARQNESASAGARVLGGLAQTAGASAASIRKASELGAALGARSYSKQFELEADYKGAKIAQAAGYDALRGALYFTRIPDPGDRFLGSHPPNRDRLETVRAAVAGS